MGGSNAAFLLKSFNLHTFYLNKFGMLYVCDGYMVCYFNILYKLSYSPPPPPPPLQPKTFNRYKEVFTPHLPHSILYLCLLL